jgi:peptidylprolyl isomerase
MRKLAVLVLAVVLAVTGCSSSDPSPSASGGEGRVRDITVTTSDTRAPALEWNQGLVFNRAESAVLWEGDGAYLIDGQPLLLDIYVQSLENGRVLENTFDGLPRSFLLAPELLGDDLFLLLRKQRVGARVISVAPPVEGFEGETTIAIVIDVLSDRAIGETVAAPAELPVVVNQPTGEPDIVLRDPAMLPAEMAVSTLMRGTGDQVESGSFVLVQYKAVYTVDGSDDGVSWLAGDVFDSTWPAEKAPYAVRMGAGETIRALEEGLIDQSVGSQVMIIAPEAWGYPGKGTLVFVVDILDVWTPDF